MNIVFLFERKVKILGKIKEILYRSIYDMEVNYKQAQEILRQTNGVLLDVRSHQEYDEEHLPNAINIDLYNLQNEIQREFPSTLDNKFIKFYKDRNYHLLPIDAIWLPESGNHTISNYT